MRFFWRLFAKIALFQPLPHYARTKDGEPLSILFYKKVGDISFQRNRLGQMWLDFFLNMSSFFMKFVVKRKRVK